ncbi:unnamed protein product [Ranitomeya imitator]|uniref:Chromo domain-containing protein n=1 Tax=Ranitomeya imitator TaxID=111125 RepID=A0ABN9L757_9NEOB|nr:unnamed protein product [Ranitomeya imitator]
MSELESHWQRVREVLQSLSENSLFAKLENCEFATDETKPFLLDVDASSVGVGAVLSQEGEDGVHPCAFFSKIFSETELNYDVGNRELLAIKLAFEHWRHLLEGARHLIQVFTNHKNLIYLDAAKRLNARQAREASIFRSIGAAVPEEESFSGNLDSVWTNVHHNLKETNRRSKKYFDKKRREALFAVGDMVWLSSRDLCLNIPSKKLLPKFVGPFKVVQVVNSAVKVDTPDKEAMPTVPPIDEDGEFEISHILESRWHRGRLQYLMSWKGFGPEDNSWVKAEDVSTSRLIKAFHRRFPNKARPGDPHKRGGTDNDPKHTSRLRRGYLTKKESDGVLR